MQLGRMLHGLLILDRAIELDNYNKFVITKSVEVHYTHNSTPRNRLQVLDEIFGEFAGEAIHLLFGVPELRDEALGHEELKHADFFKQLVHLYGDEYNRRTLLEISPMYLERFALLTNIYNIEPNNDVMRLHRADGQFLDIVINSKTLVYMIRQLALTAKARPALENRLVNGEDGHSEFMEAIGLLFEIAKKGDGNA